MSDCLKCLVVAAHPDDETIGAAIWMKRHAAPLMITHLTDGSPADLKDALAAGYRDGAAYARARREELRDALTLIGVSPDQCIEFGVEDQTAYLHLGELIRRIGEIVDRWRPEFVLSPAYEGGHPDHDAAAFAIATLRHIYSFRHCEYRLYHARSDGGLATDDFLRADGVETELLELTSDERELKRRMIQAFRTQTRVLSQFQIVDERFRDAPSYDFTQPPHEGRLMYECWGLPVSGDRWREQIWQYTNR